MNWMYLNGENLGIFAAYDTEGGKQKCIKSFRLIR